MRKYLVISLVTLMIILLVNLSLGRVISEREVNSIKLQMMGWRKAEGRNELDRFANVHWRPLIDGFRAENESQIRPSPYVVTSWPVKTQFLVKAIVPEGVKRVVWNLSGANVNIIAVPVGSTFRDSNHVVTPVGVNAIEIENPQYCIAKGCYWLSKLGDLKSEYDLLPPIIDKIEDFYKVKGEGEEEKVFEFSKSFTVGEHETFILITSSLPDSITDIVAYCEDGEIHPAERSVYASVKWEKQPPPVIEGGKVYSYKFSANLVDEVDPINQKAQMNSKFVSFKIIIKNTGGDPIPLELLRFTLIPDGLTGIPEIEKAEIEDDSEWWSWNIEEIAGELGVEIADLARRKIESPITVKGRRIHGVESTIYRLLFPGGGGNPPPEMRDALTFVDECGRKRWALKPGREIEVPLPPFKINWNKVDQPFEIGNTELLFVGPITSNLADGYSIRTNESTTLMPVPRKIKPTGIATIYDGNILKIINQGEKDAGVAYVTYTLPSGKVEKNIPPQQHGTEIFEGLGPKEIKVSFTAKVRVEGKIKSAERSVIVRY